MKNIEIKAKARDWDAQLALAKKAADRVESFTQRDVFFESNHGRLKLREQSGAPAAELIYYQRPDSKGPKASLYETSRISDPLAFGRTLALALGVKGEVRKKRIVCHVETVRVHFDEVEGLGRFIELEAVVGPGETDATAQARAEQLMLTLGIHAEDLLEGAYVDLPAPGAPRAVPSRS